MRLFPEMANQRPKSLNDSIKPKVLNKIADLVGDWHESLRDKEVCEYIYDYHMSTHNGFEIAKALDDKFYINPDSSLVELLDEIWYIGYEAIETLQKEWISVEQIDPLHSVGDQVKVNQKNNIYSGTITRIDFLVGKYTINIPDLGHVPQGQMGTQGIILNWEDIDNINLDKQS